MKNNIRYKGNTNNTSAVIFFNWRTKTPSDVTLLGRTSSEVFVMLVVVVHSFLFFILLLLFFIHFVLHFVVAVLHFITSYLMVYFSLLFNLIPHPSVDYCGVFTPILYFQPSPLQSDLRTFHFQPFRDLLFTVLSRALRFCVGIFYPQTFFYLTLLYRHYLRLSRPPWELAVLPWSLESFILILETQTRPIVCLIHSNPQSSYSERFIFKSYQTLS